MKKHNHIIRIVIFAICLIVMAINVLPFTAYAVGDEKIVRVGWYESPFNATDKRGRRSGYAYEFQQKIAAYTGWKYEYVEGSWPELMQMLIDGEIDLMSDISYTEERSELFLFSSYPMGTEEYYLFVAPDNTEYSTNSYAWLNGKKVGINKGSVMIDMFSDWQKKNNTEAEIVELTCTENESINMLHRGELDAYVILDVYGGSNKSIPVAKIGSSDFFFAVKKSRPDLLQELNAAMSSIQDENRFYYQQLYDKYIISSGANVFLTSNERNWLSGHGSIRIGYRDNCLPFCDKDDETGELVGALKDYLEYASECFENAHPDFEPVPYPTAEAAMTALKNGEVDCVFPSGLNTYDAETQGLFMTPPIMKSEIYAVVRKTDMGVLTSEDHIIAAFERGDYNYTSVVPDQFPKWEIAEYPDMQSCLRAVKNGEADVVSISNYQYNSFAKLCNKYKLTTIPTGEELELYIAVSNGNKELYSILTRMTGFVNGSAINASLMRYSANESKTSLIEFIRDNPLIDFASIVVILALVAVIVIQHRLIRFKKDAEETHHRVEDLNKRVYFDPLTSVRNKGAFDDYINKLNEHIKQNGESDIAIAIFDCNDLKQINDMYGHDKGDVYIQASAKEICSVFKNSQVFRLGGDEFAVVMQNEDFQNRDALKTQFENNMKITSTGKENGWENVNLAVGIADYDPETDYSLDDTIRRADKNMYENKRLLKKSIR